MTKSEMKSLDVGDIVRSKDGLQCVVTGVLRDHVTAAAIFAVTKPSDWELLSKHTA